MVYRVRRRKLDAADDELLIEANSPAEAMVKFQCAADAPRAGPGRDDVVSVMPEPAEEAFAW